ncbi:hypothetical protein [Pontibacter sp. H249]|uniref:hypothetical protein n=1 Tax=Pontibacter sp. H249 TaxID=3133420 RepID=UPI0030C379CF
MKKMLTLAFMALAFTSCDKEDGELTEPLTYVHKQINSSFKYTAPTQVDVNDDGKNDFSFGNVLVSDSRGGHNLFYVRALEANQVLLNMQEEISIGHWSAALQVNDMVQEDNSKNFQWVRGAGFLLDQRKPDEVHTFYEGPLASYNTLYLGIRLKEGDTYKTGWIKLSYIMGSEKVDIVEAAFHPSASKAVKAGER